MLLKNALVSLLLVHDLTTHHVVAFRGRSKGFQADDDRRRIETKAVKCSKSETATDTAVECGGVYNRSVTLQHNLKCTSTFPAITLNGPDTTLDCQGKAIIGDPTVSGTIGILANNGVTVQNCLVTGVNGVAIGLVGGMSQVLDTTVINTDSQCSSNDECDGIVLLAPDAMDEFTVDRVQVFGFGGNGILSLAVSSGHKITIRNSLSAGNGRSGIDIDLGAAEATIENVASFQNEVHGLVMEASTAYISGANIFENGEDGIDIDSSSIATLSNVESVFNGEGDSDEANLENYGNVILEENIYLCYGDLKDVRNLNMGTTSGEAICDTANSVNFNCTGQCDANGTAAATVCVPN